MARLLNVMANTILYNVALAVRKLSTDVISMMIFHKQLKLNNHYLNYLGGITMRKYIGRCEVCGKEMHHDDDKPVSGYSNVGDYDFICYPCQFEAMDNGTWEDLKARYL